MPAADPPSGPSSGDRPPRTGIYSLEAKGILIMGTLALIFILARYWHHIAWSAR